MAAPTTVWAVTEIAHPGLRDVSEDCVECLVLAEPAITQAVMTGSKGCTYGEGSDGHKVTVVRSLQVVRRLGTDD